MSWMSRGGLEGLTSMSRGAGGPDIGDIDVMDVMDVRGGLEGLTSMSRAKL